MTLGSDVNEKSELHEKSSEDAENHEVENLDKKDPESQLGKSDASKLPKTDSGLPHKNIELDTGDLKVRIRSRWWQVWQVYYSIHESKTRAFTR